MHRVRSTQLCANRSAVTPAAVNAHGPQPTCHCPAYMGEERRIGRTSRQAPGSDFRWGEPETTAVRPCTSPRRQEVKEALAQPYRKMSNSTKETRPCGDQTGDHRCIESRYTRRMRDARW